VNYNWRIIKLGLSDQLNQDGVLLENAVVQVQWKLIAEDTDGVRASYVGTTALNASSIPANQFLPLNDVTSAQVITWLQDILSGTEQDRINKQLDAKIERNRLRTIKPNW
jgi:hypothetical protein